MGGFCEELEVDVGGDGGLFETGLKDRNARNIVGERNVDELVKTTRTEKSRVDLVGSVRCANDEDVLLHLALFRVLGLGRRVVDVGVDLLDPCELFATPSAWSERTSVQFM